MVKKLLINGVIIVGAVAMGVAVTMGPWRVYRTQNAQSERRIQEMNAAEAHGIVLLQAEDRAQSSIGREEASRKAGYVGPGEILSSPDKK